MHVPVPVIVAPSDQSAVRFCFKSKPTRRPTGSIGFGNLQYDATHPAHFMNGWHDGTGTIYHLMVLQVPCARLPNFSPTAGVWLDKPRFPRNAGHLRGRCGAATARQDRRIAPAVPAIAPVPLRVRSPPCIQP